MLEAAQRIGGRAWTDYPAALGGVWFDMGSVWLHAAEQNPLVPIARDAGEVLLRADELRREKTFVGSREATAAEYADFAGAWPRFEAAAERILRERDDAAMAEVARLLPDDAWAVTVETWEGPIICCVEARSSVCGTGSAMRCRAATWCRRAGSARLSLGGWGGAGYPVGHAGDARAMEWAGRARRGGDGARAWSPRGRRSSLYHRRIGVGGDRV